MKFSVLKISLYMVYIRKCVQLTCMMLVLLFKVGKQTASTSKDEILRKEMPPTFIMVEKSSGLLVEASVMLKEDPYSVPARKKLIDGARGA